MMIFVFYSFVSFHIIIIATGKLTLRREVCARKRSERERERNVETNSFGIVR